MFHVITSSRFMPHDIIRHAMWQVNSGNVLPPVFRPQSECEWAVAPVAQTVPLAVGVSAIVGILFGF
jgi:hypothetical protein